MEAYICLLSFNVYADSGIFAKARHVHFNYCTVAFENNLLGFSKVQKITFQGLNYMLKQQLLKKKLIYIKVMPHGWAYDMTLHYMKTVLTTLPTNQHGSLWIAHKKHTFEPALQVKRHDNCLEGVRMN